MQGLQLDAPEKHDAWPGAWLDDEFPTPPPPPPQTNKKRKPPETHVLVACLWLILAGLILVARLSFFGPAAFSSV